MKHANADPVLCIGALKELLAQESEIVRRIQAKPNGGNLLLLDPQRLLRDIHVEMTAEALEQAAVNVQFAGRDAR